jgi:hypothetical protein
MGSTPGRALAEQLVGQQVSLQGLKTPVQGHYLNPEQHILG